MVSLSGLALEHEVRSLSRLAGGEEESDVGFAFILEKADRWTSYPVLLVVDDTTFMQELFESHLRFGYGTITFPFEEN